MSANPEDVRVWPAAHPFGLGVGAPFIVSRRLQVQGHHSFCVFMSRGPTWCVVQMGGRALVCLHGRVVVRIRDEEAKMLDILLGKGDVLLAHEDAFCHIKHQV